MNGLTTECEVGGDYLSSWRLIFVAKNNTLLIRTLRMWVWKPNLIFIFFLLEDILGTCSLDYYYVFLYLNFTQGPDNFGKNIITTILNDIEILIIKHNYSVI